MEHRCLDACCVHETGFLFPFFARKDPNSEERKEQLAGLSITRKARLFFMADVTRRIADYVDMVDEILHLLSTHCTSPSACFFKENCLRDFSFWERE